VLKFSKDASGEESQIVRLLWWVGENNSANRKMILSQWLSESEKGEVQDLNILMRMFNQDEAGIRKAELNEVLESNIITSKSLVSEAPFTYEELRILESSDAPLKICLFQLPVDERRDLYRTLPKVEPREGGQRDLCGLYAMLWLMEPDLRLQEEFLIPRIKAAMNGMYPSPTEYYVLLSSFIGVLTDEQNEKRQEHYD
jgi:hypothetical protein